MWTKICGIRDVSTALAVAALGADAIGLNFYAGSPRRVEQDAASHIARRLPQNVEPIGVFVNHPAAEINELCELCGFRTVQLHGDEPPKFLAQLTKLRSDLQIVRAFRVGAQKLQPLREYLAECDRLKVSLRACLVDAQVAGQYGGTGRTVSWEMLRDEYDRANWPPLILAGGLTVDNVASAAETAEAWGVDVAGGVESSPGVKDLTLVGRFLSAARSARGSSESS